MAKLTKRSKFVERCRICQMMKGMSQNTIVYMPLLIPKIPWEDLSMKSVLGLPRMLQEFDTYFVVVDMFSQTTHFIPTKKTTNATHCTKLFFKEVVCPHLFPKTITSK
jgi:hypothetical protein